MGQEFFEGMTTIESIYDSLSGFYRKGSKKVFVFVTDDNALGVNSENFFEIMGPTYNDATIFGFLNTQASKSYMDLATRSGGSYFEISKTDWSSYFSSLTDSVEDIIQNDFQIQGLDKILSISIDGRSLKEQSDYSYNVNNLKINDGVIEESSKEIKLVYTIH